VFVEKFVLRVETRTIPSSTPTAGSNSPKHRPRSQTPNALEIKAKRCQTVDGENVPTRDTYGRMLSFELNSFVATKPTFQGSLAGVAASARPGTLDVSVGTESLRAATSPEDAVYFLRDLLAAAVTVSEGRALKAWVPLAQGPWELCVCAGDGALLLSVLRAGSQPDVRVVDHPVEVTDVANQCRLLIETLPNPDEIAMRHLESLLARLEAREHTLSAPERSDALSVQWRSRVRTPIGGSGAGGMVGISFNALIPGAAYNHRAESAHADLHGLLARGNIVFDLRGRRTDLGNGFVFLQVERLVALCRPLLEAWASRRAFHLRSMVGDATVGVRLGSDELLALTVTRPDGTMTAPALDPRAFIAPSIECALALCSEMAKADRALARNLRLRALRSECRALSRWLRGIEKPDTRLNADPALYRAVVAVRTETNSEPDFSSMSKLRYTQRWHAEIEGLDLGGTLLCGDKLVVPGSRELHALDRATGAAVWSVPGGRAATTLAGDGILRLTPRGDVELRAISTGETVWNARISPRVGGPAMAHAVCAAGLPRIVVVAEGERRLVALDLRTGEARWAWTSRHGGAFKVRRVGRLLVVTAGDASVSALDLASGEVVWRYAARVPFATAPVVHREQVIALSGEGTRAMGLLHSIDAYSGALQWTADPEAPSFGSPVAAGDTVAVALATREGVVLGGFDAATGETKFRTHVGSVPGVYGARPAVTAFDDLVVINLPTGRVVAVDAASGEIRWAHDFRAPVADDVPRRLDVQLRAGALFVPQSALSVLRPRDGTLLAQVDACDLVPDVVRVDEQCALYVAEESGHLGCYEPGARLRMLRSV
jgi:outer membrane protein assembly factor BamB